ncbi:myosin-11-like isoform X1 [Mytilus californianus]|uniref:myosin-11-like isoform X1 n=1 Tax=Mytilus californianus TaxID=6549 RepID=UPI0022484D02|nr:myosin-11-like isoform X1 [Mytilus californianus]
MSDFIRDPVGLPVQRVDSEEIIYNIQLGNTIGERDWAWETICFEKEQLEKNLLSKLNELQLLQSEHEDLKEQLDRNEQRTREVQSDLEKQMNNTQNVIKRLNEEKLRNKKLELEMKNLKDLEGKINDMTNKRYQLEQDISTLSKILLECREELQEYKEELHTEKIKQKFLEQLHDMKDTALAKANGDNEKLKKKLSILADDGAVYPKGQDELIDNKRFKRKRLQECRYCHNALVPGQNTGTCYYHPRKPVHLHENKDPKIKIWQCCGQEGKVEPKGCCQNTFHQPL